jgi:hypothetical protein
MRGALAIPLENARRAIESATPRPVTPIYTELSEILQIELHRALVRQVEPQDALNSAAARINVLIERTGMRKLMASQAATTPMPDTAAVPASTTASSTAAR